MSEDPMDRFQHFQIKPQLLEHGKTINRLVNTDIISCSVQVIASGGETNLHAHKGNDAIWLVLQGAANFYTTEQRLVARLEKYEGLLIPREVPYWFESAADENLVILRLGAYAQNEPGGRIDFEPAKFVTSAEGSFYADTRAKDGAVFGG